MSATDERPAVPAVPQDQIADVAAALRVSQRTAYRMAVRGDIPSYRVGGQLRFDLTEVAEAIRATRRSA